MMKLKTMLMDGLTDADTIGFAVSFSLAFRRAGLFDLQIFNPGYRNSLIFSNALAGLASGAGLQIARRV